MSNHFLDAATFKALFLAGASNINRQKNLINDLNVFPVPDGDTGTNMSMTISSAAFEVEKLTDINMETLSKAISSGSLRGARGNSGVILSQLFRGFTKEIASFEQLDVYTLANACQRAVETAYRAVIKPKEGTILTVSKAVAQKALEIAPKEPDIEEFLSKLIEAGNETLKKTPDMLPVLKQAGVVDSGGQGLMAILQGAYDALTGNTTETYVFSDINGEVIHVNKSSREDIETSDIKFAYCTEFIILTNREFTKEEEESFKNYLSEIGDSIVVVADDSVVKVHVHTNDPGQPISKALTYGELTNMKIDNMREEHREAVIKDSEKLASRLKHESEKISHAEPEKEFGFVCVASGKGLSDIFTELGADEIIKGGQTMNPSTEDICNAVNKVKASNVFILPNNKNIVLAANQASLMSDKKNVCVIPSVTIPQGISAMLSFMDGRSLDENKNAMNKSLKNVLSCEITYAVRKTNIDGHVINEGDYMGIGDKGLLSADSDIRKTIKNSLSLLINSSTELVTIYYGDSISEDEANNIRAFLNEEYPEIDIETAYGGQPVYYYIISVE